MKRILPVALALALSLTNLTRAHAAEPPPAVVALKAAGLTVNPMREGGWNVDVKDAASLTDDVWKQLSSLPEIKRFSGNGPAFDDALLARLTQLPSIEILFFNGPGITDEGLATLAKFPKLQRFAVDHSTKITGSGLGALKGASLTSLHFGGCIVGDAGVEALVQLAQLKEVELGHTRITRFSFPLLAKLPNLERLVITPNWDPKPYTAADFGALVAMKNLRELEVHDMVLPWDGGLAQLKALPKLDSLKLLFCYVAEADQEKLKAGLPAVKLDIKSPAGEDKLKQYNERLEKLRAAAK